MHQEADACRNQGVPLDDLTRPEGFLEDGTGRTGELEEAWRSHSHDDRYQAKQKDSVGPHGLSRHVGNN